MVTGGDGEFPINKELSIERMVYIDETNGSDRYIKCTWENCPYATKDKGKLTRQLGKLTRQLPNRIEIQKDDLHCHYCHPTLSAITTLTRHLYGLR